MRVVVVNTHVPFTTGGAELHADNLVGALREHGHEVELVQIPFNWQTPWSVLDHLMAARLLDLERVNGKTIDQVIGLRFPAYHVRHPNKVLWIIHQYRSAFDFWDDPRADLAQQEGGRTVRDAIRSAERNLLGEARALFANSKNVQKRLWDFCKRESTALYHPPALAADLKSGDPAGYFLCPGRLDTLKRQDFVLDALARCQGNVHVKFVGPIGSDTYFKELKKKVSRLSLDDRVEWCGYVSKQELVDLYAGAQAIIYTPHDEDYGYVALEAQIAEKPLLTTEDSGGVLEFVDEAVGWVSTFDSEAFADVLDTAWADRSLCHRRGRAGRERYLEMGISWGNVVDKLIQK